jgi:mono/diheme cytochrome c family protein
MRRAYESEFDRRELRSAGLQLYDRRPWWERTKGDSASGLTSAGFSAAEAQALELDRMERIHRNCVQCHGDRTRIATKAGRPNGRILTPTYHGLTPAATNLISALVAKAAEENRRPTARNVDAVDSTDHADPRDWKPAGSGYRTVEDEAKLDRPLTVSRVAERMPRPR